MRIIAGIAKGKKLLSPDDGTATTRPTLDRVKEAMFSIIQTHVPYSTVLDVFAGTGSLGIEAVSRGAKKCYLVDKSPETFPLLKKNVENLDFSDKCECLNMDSCKALEHLNKKEIVFNLIFIDPPYRKNMIPSAIEYIANNNLLQKDGVIVTKIDSIEEIFQGNEKIILTKSRKYGNTTVCIYSCKE